MTSDIWMVERALNMNERIRLKRAGADWHTQRNGVTTVFLHIEDTKRIVWCTITSSLSLIPSLALSLPEIFPIKILNPLNASQFILFPFVYILFFLSFDRPHARTYNTIGKIGVDANQRLRFFCFDHFTKHCF